MNEKIFKQIMSDMEGIAVSKGEELEEKKVEIFLINKTSIKELLKNITVCDGYVKILYHGANLIEYKFIPYTSIVSMNF